MLCLSFLSVGSALLNPSISALTSLFSPQSEQGKNLGILRGFGSLARAFSPTLFSLVYFQFGSNSSFVLALLIFILVLSLLLKIPERKNVF
jgi:MFS family permease